MLERLNILFLTLFVLLLVGAGAYIYLDTSLVTTPSSISKSSKRAVPSTTVA